MPAKAKGNFACLRSGKLAKLFPEERMRFAVIIFVLKGIHQLFCLVPHMLMKHHKTPVSSVYNAQSKIPRLILRRKRTLRDCWSCFSKVNAFFIIYNL